MLLRFGVANHRSILEKQEISMVASELDDATEGLITPPGISDLKLLPAAIIYGANASGKSNLLSALRWIKACVLSSGGRSFGGAAPSPFLLDVESRHKSTECDIDFILDGIRYHYGFEAIKGTILGEWLFSFKNGQRRALFERTRQQFVFSRDFKGPNRTVEGDTRPDSLFLSASTSQIHPTLERIVQYFDSLGDYEVDSRNSTITLFRDPATARRIIEFLRKIGTGVEDYKLDTSEPLHPSGGFRDNQLPLDPPIMSGNFREFENENPFGIMLRHAGPGGTLHDLNFRDESDGTKRLLPLLRRVFNALDRGTVLICDGLSMNLHSHASEALLNLFTSPEVNTKGAQLIATTHDTTLLRSPLLRRDQVWFAEKNLVGVTRVYPLTDIFTWRGDDIEKGYLQGRFGAVPFPGSLEDLIAGPR